MESSEGRSRESGTRRTGQRSRKGSRGLEEAMGTDHSVAEREESSRGLSDRIDQHSSGPFDLHRTVGSSEAGNKGGNPGGGGVVSRR